MKKEVLGVRIDDINLNQVIEKIASGGKLIFTPNPEFLVEAQKNQEFKKILNSSDLNIPDGVGLQIFGGIKNRVPGIELMLRLCEEAVKNNWTVGLFGAADGVAKKTKIVLEQKFPGIKIKFAIDGKEADRIMDSGSAAGMTPVDLLFVALGMVKQEKFLTQCHDFKIGMGVGGSFNEIIGLEKPAPKFISQIGLKWLWRLIHESKRFRRVINATIVFPFDLLVYSLIELIPSSPQFPK